MKRIKRLLIILLMFPIIVKANTNNDILVSFNNFINYYNDDSSKIYDLVDITNETLYDNIHYNIGKSSINYNKIEIVDLDNNEYKVVALVNANGKVYNTKWSITDEYAVFYYKYDKDKNEFILTNTTLYDNTGIDLLRKAYKKLFLKIIFITYCSFLIIMILVLLISHKITKSVE